MLALSNTTTRRCSVIRTAPDTLRLGHGEQVHVGVDVHTTTSKGRLHPVQVPTESEKADRQVRRRREPLIRKARSIPQQIKAILLQHGVAAPDDLAHWEHP